MQKNKRLWIFCAVLTAAICAIAFGAYNIYSEYKSTVEPAQEVQAEDEYASLLYTPGAALVPPEGGVKISADFECVSAERALYKINADISGNERLFAAGTRLYLLSGDKVRSIDVTNGGKYETEIGVSVLAAGTLADGNLWLADLADRFYLCIYSPKCELKLKYAVNASEAPYWALVSPYGDEAVFGFNGELRVLNLRTGEIQTVPCEAEKLSDVFYTQTGHITAHAESGVVELNPENGSITPIPGLEQARPISGRYAVSEAGFEGTAAVHDIYSPGRTVYLPGEAGTAGAMAESGGRLFKLGIMNRGEKCVRRLYDLNSGTLIQWTPENAGSIGECAMSADFGWGAYISGGIYLMRTDESVLAAFTESDEYIDSLPDTECGRTAKNVYRLTGVKLYWGSSCESIGAAGFSAEGAGDEESIATLKTVEEFLTRLPQGMISELISGAAKELRIYVCGNIRTVPDQGWGVGGFTDMINGSICIALSIKEQHWMQGNLAHEFWHAAEYRMRILDEARGTSLVSSWSGLMPESINALYWNTSLTRIDSRWTQSTEACGDGTDDRDNIWFVRAYSRSDPGEDRATVFEAMHWDEELRLLKTCVHLREKADYVCALLRECYPSCREAEQLTWEQNLYG